MNIEAIKPEIAVLAKKYNLDLVVLFGSQASGRTHAKSDVDIAFSGKGEIDKHKLVLDLDQLFKRDDIETVDLSKASPTLMRAIVKDGGLLYEKDTTTFLRWKFYAIRTWMETAWLRAIARKNLIEWSEKLS